MKAMIMNKRKYFVAAMVLSTVLVAFVASFRICQQTHPGTNTVRGAALSGPSGKFGPTIESVLSGAETQSSARMLDLETGRVLLQPPLEYFNSRAELIMGWISSNSLDISCWVWSTGAICVTYDMTVVAVESKCWEQTTAEELLGNPALAPRQHSPRRLLVLGVNQPDTYIFRTGDGTLGMLQLVGVTQQGVKIRYKLINPVRALSAVL
jgi:hypothetical protein